MHGFPIPITALYAGVLGILLVAISARVSVLRAKFKVMFGDGGKEPLMRDTRARKLHRVCPPGAAAHRHGGVGGDETLGGALARRRAARFAADPLLGYHGPQGPGPWNRSDDQLDRARRRGGDRPVLALVPWPGVTST